MRPKARLSTDQLAAVRRCVEVLVDRDQDGLNELVGGDRDIYLWTDNYGKHGQVDLVLPPGDAADWNIDAIEVSTADRPTVSVHVPMWTQQEGQSDLTLDLTLRHEQAGQWSARINDLHVL